jgi:hypothetical protein
VLFLGVEWWSIYSICIYRNASDKTTLNPWEGKEMAAEKLTNLASYLMIYFN